MIKEHEIIILGDSVSTKGYVKLIDIMGDEEKIVRNARVCTATDTLDISEIEKERLIRLLVIQDHGTPLEHVSITLKVKSPIFVTRQWFRHRIASYNEKSQRYTSNEPEFFIPSSLRVKKKDCEVEVLLEEYASLLDQIKTLYNKMLDQGVVKEQARLILPLSTYTEFYVTSNLRSLLNFINLRADKHSQTEMRKYANAVAEIISEIFPAVWHYFCYVNRRCINPHCFLEGEQETISIDKDNQEKINVEVVRCNKCDVHPKYYERLKA